MYLPYHCNAQLMPHVVKLLLLWLLPPPSAATSAVDMLPENIITNNGIGNQGFNNCGKFGNFRLMQRFGKLSAQLPTAAPAAVAATAANAAAAVAAVAAATADAYAAAATIPGAVPATIPADDRTRCRALLLSSRSLATVRWHNNF